MTLAASIEAPHPLAADLDQIIDGNLDLFEELRGQRLFITGGTGFFGCWLLETLLRANRRLRLGVSAVVLTRDRRRFERRVPHLADDPAIVLQQGDVQSFETPDGDFSAAIHAAADMVLDQPRAALEAALGGTSRVLDLAIEKNVHNVLLTSSGAVYGEQPRDMAHIDESYNGAPNVADSAGAYGEAKRLAELAGVIAAREGKVEFKIARCFAFVGPYLPLDAQFAIGNFIRDGLNGGPVRVLGDGTPLRSYLYASDLAVWLWTILLRGESGRPYNVGSEEAVSIRQVAEEVALATGTSVSVAKVANADDPPSRYVPSTKRAASELNLRQTVSLRDSIAKTTRWNRTR
jgi:dTDP-glucose 4,6-dehydratase